MNKKDALSIVRAAVAELAASQGSGLDRFRAANAALVKAQLAAADAGASSREISAASEWNGIAL